jgi:hypothetical protein
MTNGNVFISSVPHETDSKKDKKKQAPRKSLSMPLGLRCYAHDAGILVEVPPPPSQDTDTMNLIICFDTSSSMTSGPVNYVDIIKNVLVDFVEHHASCGMGIAIITYSNSSKLVFSTNSLTQTERNDAICIIQRIHGGGATNFEDMFDLANDTSLRLFGGVTKMVLLTDGEATSGCRSNQELAAKCHDRETHTIMLRNKADHQLATLIKQLNPKNTAMYARDVEDLSKHFMDIMMYLTFATSDIFIKIGEVTKTIFAHDALKQTHVNFERDELSDSYIIMSNDKEVLEAGNLNSFLCAETNVKIDMLVSICRAKAKLASLNNAACDARDDMTLTDWAKESKSKLSDIWEMIDNVPDEFELLHPFYRALKSDACNLLEIQKIVLAPKQVKHVDFPVVRNDDELPLYRSMSTQFPDAPTSSYRSLANAPFKDTDGVPRVTNCYNDNDSLQHLLAALNRMT